MILGDGWFQHVENDHPSILIPGIKHATNYRNAHNDLSNWTIQRDAYISSMNDGEVEMNSTKHILLVEMSEVAIFSDGGL